jgi:hypothetical protein
MIYKLVCASNDSFSKLYKKDDNEIIIAVDGFFDYFNPIVLNPWWD